MNMEMLILAGVLFVLLLAILPVFIRRTLVATIDGFSWVRKISFEQLLWVEESSYSGFPEGSRNQQSKIENYSSYQIVSYNTRTTQINGVTSTTTEPVYGMVPQSRTKYMYEIQRWLRSRELVAKGDKHYGVHWPPYTLDASTAERIDDTKETYLVFFRTAKGKQYQQKLSESDWNDLDDTLEYELRVNLYGKITSLPKVLNRMEAPSMNDVPQQEMR